VQAGGGKAVHCGTVGTDQMHGIVDDDLSVRSCSPRAAMPTCFRARAASRGRAV
jgi:hypothetical protein